MKVLVAYASKRGSTREVAEAIAETLRRHGLSVEIEPAGAVASVEDYGAVVLGGSLYMGRLHADARRFLDAHRAALARRPLAVFAMGPQTLEESDVAGSRAQLDKALAKVPELEPAVAVFGGVVDPSKLRFPLSRLPASDARDWDAIAAWAAEIARVFAADLERV